jgi:hypothetical protein
MRRVPAQPAPEGPDLLRRNVVLLVGVETPRSLTADGEAVLTSRQKLGLEAGL